MDNQFERRYSDMTIEELRTEIGQLTDKARKAEQMGMVNEYAVYERKIQMAKAYTMNPEDYHASEVYELAGDPGQVFKINYMNGVFAWGVRQKRDGSPIPDAKEEAVPISILGEKIQA